MERLPCEVVRDLLPTYADGLTGEKTNALMGAHLETCSDCRAALDAMRAPEAVPETDRAELDYLKKNRKRNRRVWLWSLLAAALVICAVLAARAFVIGSEATPDWLLSRVEVEGDTLTLSATPMDSVGAVGSVRFEEEDGVITATTRRVLTSPLHRGGVETSYTAAGPIRQVIVNGRVVWDDGVEISAFAAELCRTRHAYVGDASANSATARVLFLGPYEHELQTDAAPYGWTIKLMEGEAETLRPAELSDAELARLAPQMRSAAYVLLGLVENLDRVSYAYSVNGAPTELTVTAEEATAFLREQMPAVTTDGSAAEDSRSIKDCYDSPAMLETLLRLTGLQGTVYLGRLSTSQTDWQLTIVNGTGMEIQTMTLTTWFQGDVVSSETGMHADETPLRLGDTLSFTVSEVGSALGDTMRLEFETPDGRSFSVAEEITPAPNLRLTLTGDEANGFSLEP